MVEEITIEKEDLTYLSLDIGVELQREILSPVELGKKKVIVLAGPTGCGKSALALMLAQAIGGEVVSADSMQVYRGMDIGTAKASQEDRSLVPHHLIDIRDVTEIFNVVDFYYEARHACQVIHSREGVSIVVGGSGFYIHSLLYGPPGGPPSVPRVRESLEEEIAQKGTEALYARLQQLDPEYAKTITIHDKQKIVRALEIITLTGTKVSRMAWNRTKPQNYNFRCWFLHRPREALYRRIEKRCKKMLEAGLLDEVEQLEKEGIRQNPSASQAIGYRQSLDFLDTEQTKRDYQRFVEAFQQASRNYAKRQLTWFRQEPIFRWLDLDLHDPETVVDIILSEYERWQ